MIEWALHFSLLEYISLRGLCIHDKSTFTQKGRIFCVFSKQVTPLEKRSEEKPNISINACATILAELDARSYQQSLVRDASHIAERILQPMSLPWTHKVLPVARNIPCDIDEMIDVLTADDGFHAPFDNGSFGFGQFETGRRRNGDSVIRLANSSENFRSASRRSADPGCIEFSTVALPSVLPSYHPESLSTARLPLPNGVDEHQHDVPLAKGAKMLRCFESSQGLKRRKTEEARSCVTTYEVSVKVNSTSSRSTIFEPSIQSQEANDDHMPIVLEATLPIEVENGRKTSKTRAKIESENLGSYDIGHGLPPPQVGKGSNRISVGRTRLVWTSKDLSDQRLSYRSLITGQQLDNGAVKRPRNMRVVIKVGGDICRGSDTESGKVVLSETRSQASLQCDQLVRNLLDGKNDRTKSSFFVPPLIECVPDSAGSIHVVCTSPGTLLHSSVTPILKLARRISNDCCSVCWRSTEGGSEVRECVRCGLLAHDECCLNPGELRVESGDQCRKEEWICSVCCHHKENDVRNDPQQEMQAIKKSKRKPRPPIKLKDSLVESVQIETTDRAAVLANDEMKCSICSLSGGAMSQVALDSKHVWVHETCRIWTDAHSYSTGSRDSTCVLCGRGSSCIEPIQPASAGRYSPRCTVKCAAAGCHISVHPMCALASTLTSQSTSETSGKTSNNGIFDEISNAKKRDEELCSQYTLSFASIKGLAHSFGKDPGARCSTTLPIMFCGIHNPAREQSFYGLYPGGKFMDADNVLKVPSC